MEKKKNGFTLIELLAVIIILGILMIIAIPSVTKYISDSRKSAYVDTAKQLIGSARNIVNSGEFEMYDTNTTYYIDVACIKSENDTKSPYGEFVQGGAYIVVTYDGKGYDYYWTSVDDAGQGIKEIIRFDKLDPDNIESDLSPSDIITTRGIDGRENTVLIRSNSTTGSCTKDGSNEATIRVDGETGEESSILTTAKIIQTTATQANQLNQIPNTNIYIFKGGNPSNYVRFNGNELWRIIGIYGNQLKIQRVGAPSGLTAIVYHTTTPNPGFGNSSLKNYLNTTYYNSLSDTAKSLIDDNGSWNVGEMSYSANAKQAYTTSTTVTWTGKVGLVAAYEYLFASSGEGCADVIGTYQHFDASCGKTNYEWLNTGDVSWTVTPVAGSSNNHLQYLLWLDRIECLPLPNTRPVLPAVILKSSVKIVSGNGTKNNPYILE